jgi:hypothetical protein
VKNRDRFLMEEFIMKCWHVTDDIDTVISYVGDIDSISAEQQDTILNMLIGMKTMYNHRFNELMDLFSELVEHGDIKG